MAEFFMEFAIIFNVAQHPGINVRFVFPYLFKGSFALMGNFLVLPDVVVSRDDEEVVFGAARGD